MNWDDVKVFLAVAEAGSFARGARRLAISQATVWRRLDALQRALDSELFERHSGRYVLSRAGRAFMRSLEGVQRSMERAGKDLGEDPETESAEGEVRVTSPEIVGVQLAEALPALHKSHPRVVIELLAGTGAATQMAREVDISLKLERQRAEGFSLEAVFPLRFSLYASKGYLRKFGTPEALGSLRGHRLVDFDRSWAHVAPRIWHKFRGHGASVVFRTNSPHARRAAACAGLGLGIFIEPFVRGSGLQKVLPVDPSLELMMFVNAKFKHEPRVLAAREFIAAALGGARRAVATSA